MRPENFPEPSRQSELESEPNHSDVPPNSLNPPSASEAAPRDGELDLAQYVSTCDSCGARRLPERKERSGFVEALVLVMVALVLALTVKTYVAEAYEIRGRSMEKTFQNGQRVVVLKSFYGIQRGDIIVFASSEDPGKDLIKRVIGLPGETVKMVGGKVYINGARINEDYALHDARDLRDHPREERVEEGHYYVLGDNRPDSHDSRAFHAIPATSLKGKVLVRWWPLSQLSSF